MTISGLFKAVWRYRITTLVVMLVVLAAAVGVVHKAPPTYRGTATYLLIVPPAPPTDAQIKADPSLRNANTDNPYTRYQNNAVIINVIAASSMSQREASQLVAKGASPNYTVAPDTLLGTTSPIIDIQATASSQEAVDRTLDLVSATVVRDLHNVQAQGGLDPHWMFTARLIDRPTAATRVYSGTMRALVGVMAMGAIVLILALSLRMSMTKRREAKARLRPAHAVASPLSTHLADTLKRGKSRRQQPEATDDPDPARRTG